MKNIFAILLITLSHCAPAQSQQHSPTQSNSSKLGTNNSHAQPAPTVTFPTSQEITEAIASGIDRANEKYDASHPPLPPDNSSFWFNLFLVGFTGLLVVVGGSQCYLIFWTLKATEIAANAAKESADTLVSTSMPALFPTVVNMAGLHPLIPIATPYTHDSNIFINFENFGGTPATIREVRAKLYLTLKDMPPIPNPSDWPKFSYPVMIPGNSRADDQHFGALDMKQTIVYGPSEIAELHAEADPEGVYRRFVLMGQVTYDDFFGWRHVRTFCVKLRAWVANENGPLNQFQVGMGGSTYNKWAKEKIPNPDPLENT